VQVGDLVRVLAHWGGKGTVGIITRIDKHPSNIITLDTGWEYRVHELEVISEGR